MCHDMMMINLALQTLYHMVYFRLRNCKCNMSHCLNVWHKISIL